MEKKSLFSSEKLFRRLFLSLAILLMLFSTLALTAQVGIGTDQVANSEALVISSRLKNEAPTAPGRGFLPTRVALTSETDATTIPNAAHALAVYNTNGLPGFFYWDTTQTPKRWRRLMDVPGTMELIVPVKNETGTSSGGASQATGTGTPVAYTIGELSTVRPWVKVPGLDKQITIYSATNNVTIIGSVPLQINNSGNNNTFDVHSYAIGIFRNNQLVSVRPFSINAATRMNCAIEASEIKVNLSNLPVGQHNIEVFVITRSKLSGTATSLTWATPATGCSNLNGFMTRGNISIQTQQF